MDLKELYGRWNGISLPVRIVAALILGTALALAAPGLPYIHLLGDLFIAALKAAAPFLVFFCIIASLSKSRKKLGSRFRYIILLYLTSTIIAAMIAVTFSMMSGLTVTLSSGDAVDSPESFEQLISDLLLSMVSNPVAALMNGTYLSILFWAVIIGMLMKSYAKPVMVDLVQEASDIMSAILRIVISFAPFGIFGIIYDTISNNSLSIFTEYGSLILLLVCAMGLVMFVVNPLLVFFVTKKNPFPLLFKCLRTSGVTAFFTRSSAANIPVNLELAEKMKLDNEFYSVSIPLGGVVNMSGAAVTISTMAVVAANSVGVEISLPMAAILCIIASLAACGASGVTGGSLLLIPLACSLFGISNDVAMNMIAIGFIIGVIQDSVETALNSSSDLLFTAAADMHDRPDAEFNI